MSLAEFTVGLPHTPSNMPLEARVATLVDSGAFVLVDVADAARFAAEPGDSVILLTADTRNNPESWDALIVLPEVLRGYAGRLRAAIALPAASAQLALRFGARTYPSLLFQRAGDFVGIIDGLQDWDVYVRRTAEMLAAPVGRAPSIGVAVVSGGDSGTCH